MAEEKFLRAGSMTVDEHLAPMKEAFENAKGNERARMLLRTVWWCGMRGLAWPRWLEQAWASTAGAWDAQQYGSLDKAFGAEPMHEKTRLRIHVRSVDWPQTVEKFVECVEKQGRIDWAWLAAELGEGHGQTSLQELYYAKDWQGELLRHWFPTTDPRKA